MKVLYKQGHVCISVILEPRPSAHVIIVMYMEIYIIFCYRECQKRQIAFNIEKENSFTFADAKIFGNF